jgi:hypothetical protein
VARGLFPKAEQDVVLATLEKCVVYVTSDTIESIILSHGRDRSAWDLANLHLLSVGAELLGPDAPRVVGISEETTCYVSPDCFAEDDPFADFIVHEAAHIFHDCKRRTIGVRETRTKEWLLDIEYRQRETFAYSCEAYARIVAGPKSPAERRALPVEYSLERRISDERVDPAEVANIRRAGGERAERLEGDPREVRADDQAALDGAGRRRNDRRSRPRRGVTKDGPWTLRPDG